MGLLKANGFTDLLHSVRADPAQFVPLTEHLWRDMDTGSPFSIILRERVLRFNGGLFAQGQALPLDRDQLDLLIDAGRADWRHVEPAIFGTLLERALDPLERHQLGAHYTPRAYVERLVLPTVIDPLREEWTAVQGAAVTLHEQGKDSRGGQTGQRLPGPPGDHPRARPRLRRPDGAFAPSESLCFVVPLSAGSKVREGLSTPSWTWSADTG